MQVNIVINILLAKSPVMYSVTIPSFDSIGVQTYTVSKS